MPDAIANLSTLLDIEQLEDNLFRGVSPREHRIRVFGGQVVAQALVAAERTVDGERPPHSLHSYFLLPGDPEIPIIYSVDRLRDGGSFSVRRILAIQKGRPIFAMSASFHRVEPGFEHRTAMPDVPAPEELPGSEEFDRLLANAPPLIRSYFGRKRLIHIRPVDLGRYTGTRRSVPHQASWFRAAGDLPDAPWLHRATLAYASDMTLLDTSLVVHGRTVFAEDIAAASLDHSVWFHGEFRADDWLLYAQESPFTGGARGLARGQIFTRDGRLVASTMQEGLIREARK
ncbi:acyl-CoA thioesterase II [Terrihabitans sp. B22-R8]|uniref:acyl-CoA thioesterase II n=1 Tax=Terrihabitans sp. B22-R8 TaxID=3425128 RepID=UPI00403C17D7